MIRLVALLFGFAAGLAGWATGAVANSVTIDNLPGSSQQTVVEGYQTEDVGATQSFFIASTASGQTTDPGYNTADWPSGNSYWGPNVGSSSTGGGDYETSGLTATYTAGNGHSTFGTVTLTFDTDFAANATGIDAVCCGRSVYAADIFIKSNAAGDTIPPQTFNFAISLGITAQSSVDNGVAAGLYEGTTADPLTDKTSQQVWGNSSINAVYGGAFAAASSFTNGTCVQTSSTCSASEASPTVLTGGALQSGFSLGETWCTSDTCSAAGAPTPAGGSPTLTVTLQADNAAAGSELDSIFSDFDIFWGTGDCSNAPIWGNVAGLTPSAVPEPSSLAVLLTSAIGLVLIRRRKRMLSTAG